ncbi:MAG TPA: hypothetical protein VNA15_10050, partial [Candidatus Angelobacter sp.]|nr:hypothetical protein [Candidatus Angelobacter sp.]
MTSRQTTTAKRQIERPSFRVPRSMTELTIKNLVKAGIIDRHFFVKTDDQTTILPLVRNPTQLEIDELRKIVPNLSSGTEDFEPRTRRPRTLEEALGDRMSSDSLSKLPRSFDIVGDVAILELDPELAAFETGIAGAIMEVHPNV